MTRRNADNAREAVSSMTEIDQTIQAANKRLELFLHSMGQISASSPKIYKIIKVIDEIAFQTNILALNAATSEELSAQSEVLRTVVQQLNDLVGE